MGTVADRNEAMRREYISAILHASVRVVRLITKKDVTISPEQEIVGEETTGRVDYAMREIDDLLCVTEGKQYLLSVGIAQNLAQLESSCQTNLKNQKKRKARDAFGESDYEYLYGIVSTGRHVVS